MEADGESSPQLWSPPTNLIVPVRRRHGRTSPILNPEALIFAIPILVLLIIFLILPPFFSYANHQILKPSLVQKGWDSINIFLVLIAVLCGVLANRNDDNSSSLDADGEKNLDSVTDDNIRKSIASSKWLDFPDKSEYDKMTSSRSYPDLRQESLWGCEGNEFKFFDDFEVNFHRQPEKLYHRERRSLKLETEAVAEPAPPVRRRRSVHRGRNDDEKNENRSPSPPRAAPPPPEPEFIRPVAEKTERIQRETGGATKETATAIASLQYGTQTQRKKKVKTREIYESATEDSLPPSSLAPPSTPPPPPPPPSSKGLQSLLKKSSKSKRVHSVPTTAQPPLPPPPPPNSILANIFKAGSKSKRSQLSSASSQPPPPPPPPPYSIFNNIFSSSSKSKRCQIPSASSHPPPPPPTSSILIPSFENLTKGRRFKNSDTPTPPLPPPPPGIHPVYTGKPPKPPKPNTSSHNETSIIVPPSPLIPMPPPPPPPPPFRTPEMNFEPKGDLAKKLSTKSSQRSSTELEEVHVMSSDSGHSIRPSVSCPSPDVNTKADTYISRLRDGWRLEKLNSINERQNSASTSN